MRQYLMEVHDQWLTTGSVDCETFGWTVSVTAKWYGCKVLRFVGRF